MRTGFPPSVVLPQGKVLEWLKRHAWKACIPLKGIVGSNPSLSASDTIIFESYFIIIMMVNF
jgi:hypothetical protein